MSKSQPVTQSSTQTSSIPGWLSKYAKQAAGQGAALPQFQGPYQGAGPAGLTPEQMQAMGLSSADAGMGQVISGSAYNPLSSLSGFGGQMVDANALGGQVGGLMNPFTQNVLNATGQQIDRNTAQAMNAADTSLAAQHAFGGSRQGVADAVTQAQGMLQKNQLAAQLNQGGYQNALATALSALQGNQGAAANAANIRLGAANALGGLGQTIGGLNTQDINNLLQTGGVGQSTQTAQNAFELQRWMQQYQIPEQVAQSFAGILGSLPHSTTTTGQQQQMSYSNPLMQLGGLGLGLGSLGTGGGATLGGSAMTALMGMLPFSDRRLKEDIEKIGGLFDGTPLYRFRYKGDPTPQVGLMADEVDPSAVHIHPSGYKMVDYARATERAAQLAR